MDGSRKNVTTSTYGSTDITFDNTTIQFDFICGVSMEISIFPNMLQAVITASDEMEGSVKGLLGTFNDNPNDDLTLPDGTVLSANLTEKEIYDSYGGNCK